MTKTERAAEVSRLLALAERANRAVMAQHICATGIRENIAHGTLKRAQDAGRALERLLSLGVTPAVGEAQRRAAAAWAAFTDPRDGVQVVEGQIVGFHHGRPEPLDDVQ